MPTSKKSASRSRQIPAKPTKTATTMYVTLRILVLLVMVAQFFNRNFENVFMCLLTLTLFTLPSTFEKHLRIQLPNALESVILLFIFASLILGEIQSYYTTYAHWDMILHTINGFLCAAIGFCLVDLLNREERFSLSLSPAFLTVVAFCFSMTVGVLWEFFELFMDEFMGYDMQKDTIISHITTVNLDPLGGNTAVSIDGIVDVILVTRQGQIPLGLGGYLDIGLLDTMEDLLVNFIGAIVFSILGYFYVKNRGKDKFAASFIPKVLSPKDLED